MGLVPTERGRSGFGRWPGGVEAGHSEAWASEPADLARHWLGETKDAPEELLQSEPADLARHWLRETEDAPEELLQSEPADLARHWLGETEDAPEELLLTVQEPEEEAGRPQPQGETSEALREQVIQGGEGEGWPGSCKRAQPQVDLSRRAGTAVS